MNKKMSKRQRDIKSKLMAAICMLLVSSIMMVSTTYAWFTLSTAPEVTGVNTSVGANGNLEMALLPLNGDANAVPESTAEDGNKEIAQKNLTWGNLVDVSDNSIYGTDQFKLYPSQLNVVEGTTSIEKSILSTPKYGADGRVAALEKTTVTSRYANNKFVENAEFGVRGIGNANGKTPRQAAFTNALSNAVIYRNSAKDLASNSLSNNGAVLGEIALAKVMGGAVNQTHKDSLSNIVTDLGTILDTIEMSYKQYVLAFAASSAVDNEAAWTVVSGMVQESSLDDILGIADLSGKTLPGNFTTLVEKLKTTRADVTAAAGLLATANATSVDDLANVMTKLADPNKMTLFDMTISEAKKDKEAVIQKYKGVLDLKILPEGGVYADIAEHCGDYSAGLVLKNVTIEGLGNLGNVDASMATVTAGEGKPYLTTLGTVMGDDYKAPAGESTDLVISDFYGYIIDLAFRTNASNSKLQLQPEGIDRIYNQTPGVEDENQINTMGNGASMTFTKGSDGFSDDQMKNLMKSIKIVFFTPDSSGATTGTVVGYAALDADNATNTAEGMKAQLMMVDAAGNSTGSNEIMDLTQNTPTALSVLVYLDGNSVKNADVAIGAASMVGKLNLQFSSSATLVPMDYTPLKNGNTAAEEPEATTEATENEDEDTTTEYNVTVPEGVTGNAKAAANADYTFTVADTHTLGTVTVGGDEVTPTDNGSGSYTIPAASVTGDIVITVTANTP